MKWSTKHDVYIKQSNDIGIILTSLYVNNLLVTGDNELEIDKFKQKMMCMFEMIDFGKLSHFLRMKFVTTKQGIFPH